MLTYAIIAMIAIVIGALMYLGYNVEEAQRDYKNMSAEQQAAYIDILKSRLQMRGKLVSEGEYEPDFTPVVIAAVLIALCALAGLSFCTCFFVLCFAAICFELADVLKIKIMIDTAAGKFDNVATA
ncbi:hypothetical protein [Burkholderia phage FLC9]|nr:hypothetical protein [Burkholderia phage FLC9]